MQVQVPEGLQHAGFAESIIGCTILRQGLVIGGLRVLKPISTHVQFPQRMKDMSYQRASSATLEEGQRLAYNLNAQLCLPGVPYHLGEGDQCLHDPVVQRIPSRGNWQRSRG